MCKTFVFFNMLNEQIIYNRTRKQSIIETRVDLSASSDEVKYFGLND